VRPEDVTVVVPTYNEKLNIAHLVAAIRLGGYKVLVVDDGSPDGTGELAAELAADDPHVSVIHRTSKQGLGPAYAAGFDAALASGSAVIVEMDADFSHNPNDLPRLVAGLEEGADLVIGSRYVPGGATPDWPPIRQAISRAGNIYARTMLGIPVRDATAGFRAFRADALSRLPYHRAQASGYGFQVEMAWRAIEAGLTVVEIPVVFRDRLRGKSKMSGRIVIEAMALVTLWGMRRLWASLPLPAK
jgi:dolichol-phosphate mannosyltransferase